ncbi:hypothetical protein BDR26DRAFT_628315 [Obelidium mucronatum]|nr:hypothetical protein BDR26DRAFT_628315 [Obelidium mucronatum]
MQWVRKWSTLLTDVTAVGHYDLRLKFRSFILAILNRSFTHYYVQFICVFLVGSLLAADTVAAQAVTTNLQQGCVTNYDANTDYFPEKIDTANLTNLAYTYSKNYKTIVNKFSNETIVLYQCGTPKPTVAGATQIIAVPIQNLTLGDTTVVNFLELLGQRSAIKYTTSGTSGYISSPCVQSLVASGAIIEVDSKNKTQGIQQIDSTNVYFSYMSSLGKNVSNYVSFPASADPGVKGRAEWLGFAASFFNQEAKANNIASAIATNFAQLAAAANAKPTKPIVAFIEYQAPYSAEYPAAWKIAGHDYQSDFITAAGATHYLPSSSVGATVSGATKQATVYSYNNSAAFLAALAPVEIVIDLSFYNVNSTDFTTSFAITAANSGAYKFIQNQKVFFMNNQINAANGGNNWFEAAVAQQNVVLADLISATHPEVVGSSYVPTFLRNAYTSTKQTILTAKECTGDVKAALPLPVVAVAKSAAASSVASMVVLLGAVALMM